MPQDPDFEYTYRWADGLDVDALEARDQALEAKLREGYGSSCFVDFQYHYRWNQILAAESLSDQLGMLEANMTALEQAVTDAGGCTLEFPFRWYNFWEALQAGESWAIGIAEENDRAIEFRFGRCSCIEGFLISSGTNDCELTQTVDYVLTGSGDLVNVHLEGNNTFGGWDLLIQLNGATEETISLPSGTFDFDQVISVPYVDSDQYTAALSSSFDGGVNTITFTSCSLATTVTSNHNTDTAIGSAFQYQMFLNRLGSFNPLDIVDADLQTVPGTDVTPPHVAVANSLAFSESEFTGSIELYTDNPAAPTVSYDVNSVTLGYTKTGTDPMRVTLTVHQEGAGNTETTVEVSSPGSYTISLTPDPEGPFFGPPAGGGDFTYISGTSTGQLTPCITDVVTQATGEGTDVTTGWISA